MKIDLKGQMGINYLDKGKDYTGSYLGMRYRLNKRQEGENDNLRKFIQVFIYPEPFNFTNTPEEDKVLKEFEFSQEGFDRAMKFINDSYDERKDFWTEKYNSRFSK